VILDVQPGGNIEFMTRGSDGGTTSWIAGTTHATPVFLMLARTGSTVAGSVSNDGTTWTTVGTATITLPATVDAGLAVTSHTTTQLATATFDAVAVQASSPPPPPPPPPSSTTDVVIYASDVPASALHGSWTTASDSTSPGGVKLSTPNNGTANTSAPLSTPVDYVDVAFQADAGVSYTLWLRLKALNNDKLNDSIWVQFSDASVNGTAMYPMNSTSALLVNLATDSTASSLNNWGWTHGAYWLTQPATVRFSASGGHTMRIQVREDGVQLDQIVLSSTTYVSSPPGGPTNDTTIVSK
jgi:hypothetical protein